MSFYLPAFLHLVIRAVFLSSLTLVTWADHSGLNIPHHNNTHQILFLLFHVNSNHSPGQEPLISTSTRVSYVTKDHPSRGHRDAGGNFPLLRPTSRVAKQDLWLLAVDQVHQDRADIPQARPTSECFCHWRMLLLNPCVA